MYYEKIIQSTITEIMQCNLDKIFIIAQFAQLKLFRVNLPNLDAHIILCYAMPRINIQTGNVQ